MKNIETFESTYIECDCHTELLQVTKNIEDKEVYISFYRYGQCSKHPWSYRLRHIWRIITTGAPYSDSIVLNEDEVKKLKNCL